MNVIILFIVVLCIFLFISLGINYSNIFSKTVSTMKKYKPTSILSNKYNSLTEYYSDTLAEQGVFSKTIPIKNPSIEGLAIKQKLNTKTKPKENVETWGYKGPQGSTLPPGCLDTPYGCCPDNVSTKLDTDGTNCVASIETSEATDETDTTNTTDTTDSETTETPNYGYCSDNVTVKMDESGSNCPVTKSWKHKGPYINAYAASGQNHSGYIIKGPKGNIFHTPVPVVGGCASTQYGCCPDSVSAKVDANGSNCAPYPPPVVSCAGTQYGCCPDSVTAKVDANGSNCAPYPPVTSSGSTTQYGYCPDNTTAKVDANGSNCAPYPPVSGCAGTQYGCCPDTVTAKINANGTNCSPFNVWKYVGPNVTAYAATGPNNAGIMAKGPNGNIFYGSTMNGSCSGTQYGFCPDNTTAKVDMNGSNCAPYPPPPVVGGCAGTQYGCCPDNINAKVDANGSNCAPYPPPPIQPITNTVFIPPPKQMNVNNYETPNNNETVDSSFNTSSSTSNSNSSSTSSSTSNSTNDLTTSESSTDPGLTPICPTPQPCPPCGRCPEPSFDCRKVPNYASTNSEYLPMPVLTDFSQFGM
jgi:hypothetical protein